MKIPDEKDLGAFEELLNDLDLIGDDYTVTLDLEKIKQCPFCNFHQTESNIDVMTTHMTKYHSEDMTNEAVYEQYKRIRKEQGRI